MTQEDAPVRSPSRAAGPLWTLAILVVLVTPVVLLSFAISTMDSGGALKGLAMIIGTAGGALALVLSFVARLVWRRSAPARVITPVIALGATLTLAITALILMWASTR